MRHLGLVKLSRRAGKRQAAQEHLTIATTMHREMDMRFWLEKAGAELGPSPKPVYAVTQHVGMSPLQYEEADRMRLSLQPFQPLLRF